MYLIFLHFRIPLLQFTSLTTFQPLFLQILNFLLTSNSPHFTSLITFLTRFLKKLGLERNSLFVHTCALPASHGLVISEWTWLTSGPSPPPLQPSNSLSTVQYQPEGEGATLFATPAQSSPVAPFSQLTWVSPVLHWSSSPRIIGTLFR